MKRVVFVVVVFLVGCFVLGSSAMSLAAEAKQVVLKGVGFLPVNNANVAGFNLFAQKVNEKFKDSVKIEVIGGPEVTPPFQLHEAVKSGVIDMCLTSCGYYPAMVWEAQAAMFSNKDYKEWAKTKFFDEMSKLHEKAGLVWLGAGTLHDTFHLYFNPEVKALKDLSGKRIRIFPPFIPLMKALGAVPINLPMGDIYTAMERGAIDGFVQSHLGFVTDFSWHEVTKFALDYPLYQATAVILVNPKSWAKLSPDVQKAVIEFKKESVDPAIAEYYDKLGAERWKLMMDKGVKPVKFSEEDGKALLKTAYDSAWEQVISKSPELGPRLKEMMVK